MKSMAKSYYSQFKVKEVRLYQRATGINFSCLLFARVTEAAKNLYQQPSNIVSFLNCIDYIKYPFIEGFGDIITFQITG